MRIWLITVGEPLPTDARDVRQYRTGILAELLHRQGHDVVWWTSTFDHMAKKQRFPGDTVVDIDEGYRLILLYSCAYNANVSINRVVNHIGIARRFTALSQREQRPDIILTSMPTLELSQAAINYGKRHKIPVVVDIRDLWPDIFLDFIHPLLRPLGRFLLIPYFSMIETICREATAIIGITPRVVEWGLRYAGREATGWDSDFPLAYPDVPPPVESRKAAEEFWERLGLTANENNQIACFFGSMGRQFDLETVIKAAQILAEKGKDIRFVLCGTGDNFEKYRQMAASCANVIFPGWIGAAEIWTLMRRSRVGLAPYHSTPDFELSIPNKVIEYLSAGLPVVSSLRGTVADLLGQNDCGLTYEKGNPHELLNILLNLQGQPARQQMMSKNARQLYEQRFAAENIYSNLIDHLEDIAVCQKG